MQDWLYLIVIAALLGGVGQVVRVAVGLKKRWDEGDGDSAFMKAQFDGGRLFVSILLGMSAGVLAALTMNGGELPAKLDSGAMLGLVSAGYLGADFIEGILRKHKPAHQAQTSVGIKPENLKAMVMPPPGPPAAPV